MQTAISLQPSLPRPLRLLAASGVLAMTLSACGEDDSPAAPMAEEPTIAELATTTGDLSTLAAALNAAGLEAALEGDGPFTVFAPVNAAFDLLGDQRVGRLLEPENVELLTKLLTYHVVPGAIRAADLSDGATVASLQGASLTFELDGEARVNGARIIATDIEAGNGVVHLVESVLTENLDLVDVAVIEGFSTLVSAIQAAGLEETLRTDNGGAGFTVFAPTEAAFETVGEIPTDPAVLADILLYHGVGATVPSNALSDNQIVTTLQGGTLRVDLDQGVGVEGIQNGANVLVADVSASNGIIHVIDTVLLP